MRPEKMFLVKLSDLGAQLVLRDIAIACRKQVYAHLNSDSQSIALFDFSGIDMMSSGFAMELFGGLRKDLGDAIVHRVRIKLDEKPESNLLRAVFHQALTQAKGK